MWLAIITLVAGLVAFILGWGGGVVEFIENYFQYRDDSYRPMDLDRINWWEHLWRRIQPFR
jgi:hypothetical protein